MINASFPVNITAARVISRGFNYEYNKNGQFHSDVPLPCASAGFMHMAKKNPGFIDFTGMKFGTFTVIGMVLRDAKSSKNTHAIWLVKCVCGQYETRTSKALKKIEHNLRTDGARKDGRNSCKGCIDMNKIRNIVSARNNEMSYVEYMQKINQRNHE